jgi:uncharacterized membrane protein YedE/YeeE
MIRAIVFLLSGTIFGAGLALSRMIDPAKVMGFLDITRRWDPSLAATMGGAVMVAAACYALTRRRGAPLLSGSVPPVPAARLDAPLILGSALFGAGWGLAGICPAPALAVLPLNPVVLWFILGMGGGILAHRFARPSP